jgi:uncharacterized protein (DUF58 family)
VSTNPDQGVYVTLDELVKLRPLSQGFNFLPRQPVHSLLTGQKTSKLRGRGLNFEEIRHYLPGDDVRNIDWKVTARMRGKAHIRVYTEERDRSALLLVDQRVNMFFGSRHNMKSVTAAETAAIAAWRILGAKDRVGGLVFNDTEVREVRPGGTTNRVMHLFKQILQLNSRLKLDADRQQNPAQLNKVLKMAASLATHDYLLVLISDMDGANEETRQLLTRISQHNDVMIAYIHDPMERELPELQNLAISDGKMQLLLQGEKRKLAATFSKQFLDTLEQARRLLLRRQIPLVPIDTVDPPLHQIRAALGHARRANPRRSEAWSR